MYARNAAQQVRNFSQRDRPFIVEVTRRMPFTQEVCERRGRTRGCGVAQIDFLSGPGRPNRWRRGNETGVGVQSAERIGLPSLRAARVEYKVVKVPEDEIITALGRSKILDVLAFDLEEDIAIQQQGEQFDTRKTWRLPELAYLLRRRQNRQAGCNVGIANSEQCARER